MIDALTLANVGSWFAQIAWIVVVAAALPRLVRLHAPDAGYAYWRALLALCLVLPWLQGRALPSVAGAGTTSAVTSSSVLGASLGSVPAVSRLDWVAIALWIVAAGAAARLVWIAVGLYRLRRLRTTGAPSQDTTDQDELQRILGTRAGVRYVVDLPSPVTFGLLRPVVLLPSSLLDRPDEIRRAVLAHELLHVYRRDWAWLLLEESVRAVVWFHPAMWWLISRVQLAREEVVDEMAVAITGRRRAYVEALLAFADRVPLTPAPAFARRRHLFRRMVLVSREVSMSSKRIVASCAVLALAVVAGSWYAIGAFPLRVNAASDVKVQSGPGPLEQRANPITPENPIPRRISHVEAEYPPEAADAGTSGRVTLRVTLDESGRVGEVRATGMSVRTENPRLSATVDNVSRPDEKLSMSGVVSVPADRQRLSVIFDALSRAATEAVRQWQYDPPFKGPISFNVTVYFGDVPPPPPPPPPPAPASRARRPVGAAPPPPPPPPPPPADRRRTGGRGGVAGGVQGGVEGGVPGGVPGGVRSEQQLTDDSDMAVRVGANIKAPAKIRDVRPIYPLEAREKGIQGVVILEVRIEPDGTVSDARVLRSIPMLNEAAVDAAMQWRFTPTLMNGRPVPVIMTVTVNFLL